MSKPPGRNDPCPCGSGRKFKKCHLTGYDVWQRLIAGAGFLDATEAKIAFSLAMEGRALFQEVSRRSELLQREIFGTYPQGTILDPDVAEEPLRRWLSRTEEEIARLAATDSRYFWLFLTQRLKPSLDRLQGNEQTVSLTRRILGLGILKYGASEGTPFTSLPDNFDARAWVMSLDRTALPQNEPRANLASVPVSVSLDDVFKALLMEQLARDFCGATALLRRIWKGGRLPLNKGLPDNVLHDRDTDWLIDLYDERLSQLN